MKQFKAPDHVIETFIKNNQVTEDTFVIWHENAEAFDLFLRCRNQWRLVVGMSSVHHQGLDYPALESVMNMRQVPQEDRPELLHKIQLIESGALHAFAEQRDQQ